jgi:hypothetical protein
VTAGLAGPAYGQIPAGADPNVANPEPAAAAPAAPPPLDVAPPPPPALPLSPPPASPSLNEAQARVSLQLMRDSGIITESQYQAALQGRLEPAPAPGPRSVTGKFDLSLYGFVELDSIYDSTQSFNELAGNGLIARPGTFAGEHGRTLFTMRNSRLGIRFKTPEFHRVQVVAQMEFDLLGNQPPTATELQTFVNDTFRVRHAFLELQTPWINLLFGQYWQLFGWQSFYHPATVAIQGVPGQLYSRAPQIRLSHVFKSAALNFELAAALGRAPQRDSTLPDGQAGMRFTFNKWRGVHSNGSTGTAIDAAAIGVSGTVREFALPDPAAAPSTNQLVTTLGWGVSVDAMLPIVPAKERKSWALTAQGSLVRGTGIADFYTGLTGGVAFPNTPPLPKGYGPLDIDTGLALLQNDLSMATVNWQSFLVGLQFYLPPQGKLWLAGNFSQMDSDNVTNFLAASATSASQYTNAVFTKSRWADVNLFWDATPAVRFGVEYSWFWQLYHDSVEATNHRFQFSAFYLF